LSARTVNVTFVPTSGSATSTLLSIVMSAAAAVFVVAPAESFDGFGSGSV
jgi:hypothetical protein